MKGLQAGKEAREKEIVCVSAGGIVGIYDI